MVEDIKKLLIYSKKKDKNFYVSGLTKCIKNKKIKVERAK